MKTIDALRKGVRGLLSGGDYVRDLSACHGWPCAACTKAKAGLTVQNQAAELRLRAERRPRSMS
jgi:hypothetical protein